VPGEEKTGVVDAVKFLRRVALGEEKRVEGKVVVVGGGDTAVDSARTALRLGAESATIVYRRGREEMPAIDEDVEEALVEGVEIRFLAAPVRVEGDERVRAIVVTKMRLGPADESGRRRPEPVEGSEERIDADVVIAAIGQKPELDFAASDGRLVVSRGCVQASRTGATEAEGVFVGGDVTGGDANAIEAIAAGQRAAQAIDVFLGGRGELPADTGLARRRKPEPPAEGVVERRPRVRALPVGKRRGNFAEVMKGYGLKAACDEAMRCLRCDLEV